MICCLIFSIVLNSNAPQWRKASMDSQKSSAPIWRLFRQTDSLTSTIMIRIVPHASSFHCWAGPLEPLLRPKPRSHLTINPHTHAVDESMRYLSHAECTIGRTCSSEPCMISLIFIMRWREEGLVQQWELFTREFRRGFSCRWGW